MMNFMPLSSAIDLGIAANFKERVGLRIYDLNNYDSFSKYVEQKYYESMNKLSTIHVYFETKNTDSPIRQRGYMDYLLANHFCELMLIEPGETREDYVSRCSNSLGGISASGMLQTLRGVKSLLEQYTNFTIESGYSLDIAKEIFTDQRFMQTHDMVYFINLASRQILASFRDDMKSMINDFLYLVKVYCVLGQLFITVLVFLIWTPFIVMIQRDIRSAREVFLLIPTELLKGSAYITTYFKNEARKNNLIEGV
jgi:hypothetical protein